MNTVTSKISELTYESAARSPSKIAILMRDPEARFTVLFWAISLLGTALLTLIVCLLGVTPAWANTQDAPKAAIAAPSITPFAR